MKPNSLLSDVLAEGDYPAFREALAARVEAEARLRRSHRATRWLALAACIALAAGLLFQNHRPVRSTSSGPATPATEPSYVLRTQPLLPAQILSTAPLALVELTTAPLGSIALSTDHSSPPPSISDAELLRLFPNHATALASTATGIRKFFFVEPEDARAFMSSN
jgi:hypothetical protein